MVNWQKMKMKIKNISSANQQLPVSEKATGTNAFQIINNEYPLPLKKKKSDIPNHCYMPDFFLHFLTLLLEIDLWSKLLYGNLSRYAGIHIIENYQQTK